MEGSAEAGDVRTARDEQRWKAWSSSGLGAGDCARGQRERERERVRMMLVVVIVDSGVRGEKRVIRRRGEEEEEEEEEARGRVI